MSKSPFIILTEDNFEREVLKSEQPVLVDFWADWCAPCHQIAPAIEELAHEFDGSATIAKLNVDEEPELARHYGVRSIPSLLFFRSGEAVDRIVGVQQKRVLSEKLDELVAA
jgi:thioredoxin 1